MWYERERERERERDLFLWLQNLFIFFVKYRFTPSLLLVLIECRTHLSDGHDKVCLTRQSETEKKKKEIECGLKLFLIINFISR